MEDAAQTGTTTVERGGQNSRLKGSEEDRETPAVGSRRTAPKLNVRNVDSGYLGAFLATAVPST